MFSTRSNPILHLLLGALVSSLILGLSLQNHTTWLPDLINTTFNPLRIPFHQVKRAVTTPIHHFVSAPSINRELAAIRLENNELKTKLNSLQSLQAENEQLKKALSVPITPDHILIPGNIISLSRLATIDLGTRDGLTSGQPVVSGNTLLGIVISSNTHFSQIRLLTDVDTTIPVITSNGATGILNYKNSTLIITEVSRAATLDSDQLVFTQATTSTPEGLLIGTIIEVTSPDTASSQTATVKPADSLTNYSTVLVLLD